MTLVRNEIEYTVTAEHSDKYESISEDGNFQIIPKSLVRATYNGTNGYFHTKESVQSYWKAKFAQL
jgi:hypothetical protein